MHAIWMRVDLSRRYGGRVGRWWLRIDTRCQWFQRGRVAWFVVVDSGVRKGGGNRWLAVAASALAGV